MKQHIQTLQQRHDRVGYGVYLDNLIPDRFKNLLKTTKKTIFQSLHQYVHFFRAIDDFLDFGPGGGFNRRSVGSRLDHRPFRDGIPFNIPGRSEEHTSELQSRENLVCRLLLEKKKTKINQ